MSKGVQIAGGATLIALLLGWYAATNIEGAAAFTYYQNLSEFQATMQDAPERADGMARVHGYVLPGSIERDVPQLRVSFEVQNEPPHAGGPPGVTLPVIFSSLETPDLFKDGAEVVVEGRTRRGGQRRAGSVFVAAQRHGQVPVQVRGPDPKRRPLDQSAANTGSF